MNATSDWYILRTKQKTETKLACLLGRKGFETFCPMAPETTGGQKHQQALFPSWLFVNCTPEQLLTIKNSTSASIIYRIDRPALVADEEIATIQFVLDNFREVQLIKVPIRQNSIEPEKKQEPDFFVLASLGFALQASGKVERERESLPQEEISAHLPTHLFPASGKPAFSLFRKISLLFTGKEFRHSSV